MAPKYRSAGLSPVHDAVTVDVSPRFAGGGTGFGDRVRLPASTGALAVLANEQQVEDPYDLFSLQSLELWPDLASKAVAVEADDKHLYGSVAHRSSLIPLTPDVVVQSG